MYSYNEAFTRNLGWVTAEEQQRLRNARIAIAGMGGVGGSHLLTLARLGISRFNVADFDTFELHNMNRQAGARVSSLGRPKVDVLSEMARDINPEVSINAFHQGVTEENVSAFLEDVDVYVDGLDFFVLDMRRKVFAACRERGIPAITVAPLGMGAALLTFLPSSMSFDEYFCFEEASPDERPLYFAVGLAPAMLQMPYVVEPSAVRLSEQRGPSTAMACELCAGIAATESLKLILGRGKVLAAPRGMQFDAYRGKMRKTWRPLGNRNPIQRLMLAFGKYKLRQFSTSGHQDG